MDGDGFANWEDAYPDDGGKWEEDVEEGGGSAVWWIMGITGVVVLMGVVVVLVLVGRKGKAGGGLVEDVEDLGGSGEDEVGRIEKGEDENIFDDKAEELD